jgi:ParB family chromosome partitioning protein
MTQTLTEIPVSKLTPRVDNLRIEVNGDDLVDSIRTFGVMQALNVTPDGDRYLVNAGHRRLDAAKKAGLKTVPCIVTNGDRPVDDAHVTAMMLVENLQRSDLDVIEEARGFRRLANLGWTQRQIAERTGFHPSQISRRIKLTALPDDLQERIRSGEISMEKGEALAKLAELDVDEARDAADTPYANPAWIERRADRVKLDQTMAKLEQKLAKAGRTVISNDMLGTPHDDDAGNVVRHVIMTEPVETVDEDTGEVVVDEQVRVVGTGPLELEAAFADEAVTGVAVKMVDGKAKLVAVTTEVVVPAEEVVPGTTVTNEDLVRASEKEARARKRAEDRHELEQFTAMVAGKLSKTEVTSWALRSWLDHLDIEVRKQAARYLELEPVEKPDPYRPAHMIRSLQDAFDEAVASASGAALTRLVLAATLAEANRFSHRESCTELLAEIKDALGYEPYVEQG